MVAVTARLSDPESDAEGTFGVSARAYGTAPFPNTPMVAIAEKLWLR